MNIQMDLERGDEIADAILNQEYPDLEEEMPELQLPRTRLPKKSDDSYEDKKIQYDFEMRKNENDLKFDRGLWEKRSNLMRENKNTVYALILQEYCTDRMRTNLKREVTDFEKTRNDPIALLNLIKSLMFDSTRARYPYAIITKAMKNLFGCKQQEEESLIVYLGRFKQQKDALEAGVGRGIIHGFVEKTDQYQVLSRQDEQEKQQIKDKSYDVWTTFIFLDNTDDLKYKSLKQDLTKQYSMNIDNYPKTLDAAVDILNSHPWDRTYSENKKRKKTMNKSRNGNDSNARAETSFAQAGKKKQCFCCGDEDHLLPQCPYKDTINEEQWFKKTKRKPNTSNAQTGSETTGSTADTETVASEVTTDTRSRRAGWNGFHMARPHVQSNVSLHSTAKVTDEPIERGVSLSQQVTEEANESLSLRQTGANMFPKLKDKIMLDNGSSLSLFSNRQLVYGIRESSEPVDLATNTGTDVVRREATLPGWGKVYYEDKRAFTNIMSFYEAQERYRVTYDNKIANEFRMYDWKTNELVATFKCEKKVYVMTPTKKFLDEVKEKKEGLNRADINLVTTVSDNMKGYSARQIERAKIAMKLWRNSGNPSIRDFKALIQSNVIKNCPVLVEDINTAVTIWGPPVSEKKGKATRAKRQPVRDDAIEIPDELINKHDNLTLCTDVMHYYGQRFLASIDKTIRFRAAVPLNGDSADEVYSAVDVTLRQYNAAGFTIKTMEVDGGLRKLFEPLQDEWGIVVRPTNRDDHVPEAERNIRTIKERVRCKLHELPFSMIPGVMIRHLVMYQTLMLNVFPAKGGISSHYSPHVILGRRHIDFDKHYKCEFGEFVLTHMEPKPSNKGDMRGIDSIYLRPRTDIPQGGHYTMNLHTGKVLTSSKVTIYPMTQVVIGAVEKMAKSQGMKPLRFYGPYGDNLRDDVHPAGVDIQENEDESEDESENDGEIDVDRHSQEEIQVEYNESESDSEEESEDDEDYIEEEKDTILANETSLNIKEREDESESERTEHEHVVSPRRTRSGVSFAGVAQQTEESKHEMRMLEQCHNLMTNVSMNPEEDQEYTIEQAQIMAHFIRNINDTVEDGKAVCFGQQYMLKQGLKKFGERGRQATKKEVGQLHERVCFEPISVKEMTKTERIKAMVALLFLTEKRDKSIKARMVYNGKPTREWHDKDASASPTASLESIILTCGIAGKEKRDVMSADVPNAFIQALMPIPEEGEDRVIMKITGVLVDLLIEIDSNTYGPYVVYEKGRKVLYVRVLRAIYGMLIAALLWYKTFRKDLEEQGFKFNPYDPCVANRTVGGKQHTILFHVDDLLSTHVNPKQNDWFLEWLNKKYGNFGKVVATRGKRHDYLGMTLDFSREGKVIVDMIDYVEKMIDTFPVKLKTTDTAKTPAADNAYSKRSNKKLSREKAEIFHTWVAKGLFLSKRGRLDIQPAIAGLTTRVKDPGENDWNDLVRLMKYLNGTRKMTRTLSIDNLNVVKWLVDASFATHPDFKSHTGAVMRMGIGVIDSMSRKQKLNTRSSTEAELVGVDDAATMIFWTKHFMEAQGYSIEKNILYQDNKSAILLETNGQRSAGKRSRHLNIRYFFMADQVEKGNVIIEHCPTASMTGDFMTKPLQGEKFRQFRKEIMGL